MILPFASFFVSQVLGIAIVTLFLARGPERPLGVGEFILRLSLAFGIGVGVSSALLFFYLHFFPIKFYPFWEVFGVLLLVCAVCLRLRSRVFALWRASRPAAVTASEKVLAAVLVIVVVVLGLVFVVYHQVEPHGKWDAWASWNSCARFIYGSDDLVAAYRALWQTLGAQQSYPWLYPLSTARAWAYGGGVEQFSPVAFNGLFALASVGVIMGFLRVVKSRLTGLFAGLFLLGSPIFCLQALAQYADIALAYYLLTAVVLLLLWQGKGEAYRSFLPLAGACATMAAWTKDEGILFLMVIFIVHGAYALMMANGARRAYGIGKRFLAFVGGALPGVFLLVYHKAFFIQRSSAFVAEQQGLSALLTKVLDLGRYPTIAIAFIKEAFLFSAASVTMISSGIVLLLLYGMLVDVDRGKTSWRAPFAPPAAIFLAMLLGYFLVFVVTPAPLQWHLDTLLNRLYLHLYPLLVATTLLLCKTPDEVLSAKVFPEKTPTRQTVGGKRKRER